MSLLMLLIGVAIASAFASAALARFQRASNWLDAIVMVGVTSVFAVLYFRPLLAESVFGPLTYWPAGGPPASLGVVAATSLVACVFAIRTATVGETSLLFGTAAVWGHIALAAIASGPLEMFLVIQTATWLAWVEINRRDRSSKTTAGLRLLLFTVAADLPLAFAIVQLTSLYGTPSWGFLNEYAALASGAGLGSAPMSMLVLGLISSVGVRFAMYPLSVWLPNVVETSRVGRGFSLAVLAIPLGMIVLERATSLWIVAPTARLLAVQWGTLAALAAAIIVLGQRTPLSTLAVASSSAMGLVVACSSTGMPLRWGVVVLLVSAIRPAWTVLGRTSCAAAFVLLIVVTFAQAAAGVEGNVRHVLGLAAVAALFSAGFATASNRVSDETSDELTHPHWPPLLFLAAACGAVWLVSGTETLLAQFKTMTAGQLIAGTAAMGAGKGAAVVLRHVRTGREDHPSTFFRMANRQFYIDDIVAFGLVLPVRAVAQVVRLIDWSTTRTSLLAFFGGTMRRLDRETEARSPESQTAAVAIAVTAVAIAVLVLARTP